ncbi:hypothetical protein NEFER01_2263, partial [Nematocida sp. LUAm1]
MKIFLRRERRRNYTIPCTWKVFVVFITLLSIGLSTESCLEEEGYISNGRSESSKSSKIVYDKIVDVLMDNFNIEHSMYPYCISRKNLYTIIEYIEDIGKYSIDLKEFEIRIILGNEEKLNQINKDLETILKRIDTIKVNIMYIDTEKVSDTIFSMLIERVVAVTELCIGGEYWWKKHQNISVLNDNMEKTEIDVSLTKKQEKSIEISQIVIHQVSEWIIGDILEYVKIYTIKTLVIKTDRMKHLRLNQFNAKNADTIIYIEWGYLLESIIFPGNDITRSLSVKLYDLPKLKSVENIFMNSSIAVELKNLYIDRATFKALSLELSSEVELSAKENEHKPIKKIFLAQNTFIEYAPYTFQELASDCSVPWIETVNMTFLTECDRHVCELREVSNQPYYLTMLKNIGINCLKFCGYDVFVDRDQSKNKSQYSVIFIQKLIKPPGIIMKNHFVCPSKSEGRIKISFLKIDLEESDKIQEVINEFQKKYDMLYSHAHYIDIHIHGCKEPNNWYDVMVNAFRWLGQEIKIDNLSFRSMKNLTNSDEKKEEPRPSSIELPKIKFILSNLYFYDSEISFIKHILDNYSYAPEATILIDCHKIEEKDFWDLCEKIEKEHEFSKVILKNAPKIIEKVCKKPDQIDPSLKNKFMISKGKPEYRVSLSDIADCISLKTSTLFSTNLFELKKNILKNASTDISNNNKKVFYCLVSSSMQEACDGLSKVMKERGGEIEIDSLLYLDIFIYNYCSNDDSFTTIEQVSRLIKLINKVFKKLATLTILNLRMKEKEYKNIKTLNALIDPTNKHGLQGVFLRGYIINDDEEEETVLCIKQKKEPCLHDKVEASGKEALETLDYRIGKNRLNYLVDQKLREGNVLVDHSAIEFILNFTKEKKGEYDRSLWEYNILYYRGCKVCNSASNGSKSIVIISKCKHCI